MRVVGLDLSLTATGVAVFSAHNGAGWPVDTVDYQTITSKGRRGDSLTDRDLRITAITDRVGELSDGAALAVVEGPSIMSKGGSNWDRAGLWWSVVGTLSRCLNVPVAVAAPTVVKKFAAGKGNADKATVAVGLARLLHLWPDLNPGSDNEWDAIALALMGSQRLGFDVESRAHHAACLESVEWPASLPVAA